MSFIRKPWLSGVIIAAVMAAAIAGPACARAPKRQAQSPTHPKPLKLGTIAPEFNATTLTGQKVSPQSFRGHVVLLDMWATWCGPCRASIPILERIQEKYYKQGLYVVGVNVDTEDTADGVVDFAVSHGMRYVVTKSPESAIAIRKAYHAEGIPAMYLLDKHGRIRWIGTGFGPGAGLEISLILKRALAEK